jgi:hypothetical protein
MGFTCPLPGVDSLQTSDLPLGIGFVMSNGFVMQPSAEFLTAEECAEVDKALLTAHDKFTARVAIYALRSLKAAAAENNTLIEVLRPEQVEDWVYQDPSWQAGGDREFRQFFSQLVISAMKPIKQMAQDAGILVEELTVPQVVAWFEHHAKQRLNHSN